MTIRVVSLFFVVIVVLAKCQASIDPYEKGPHNVGHGTFWSINNWGLDHNLGVWVPEASGNFPVVYFTINSY